MESLAFDNDQYLATQSAHIRERIGQFGGKLYLEFGGKLFDDYHFPGIRICHIMSCAHAARANFVHKESNHFCQCLSCIPFPQRLRLPFL